MSLLDALHLLRSHLHRECQDVCTSLLAKNPYDQTVRVNSLIHYQSPFIYYLDTTKIINPYRSILSIMKYAQL